VPNFKYLCYFIPPELLNVFEDTAQCVDAIVVMIGVSGYKLVLEHINY